MRPKLSVVLAAALALSALLLAGGASAQRQGGDNASGGSKSKRVVGVRSSDTGNGSRVTVTADDSLKDYSTYRNGDRFYVVLPKAAAGARGGGSGRGYSDMRVQQRGDSVVLSYRVQPGAKPRVEQKLNRLDVVFDVQGDAAQQAAANNSSRQQQQTPPAENRNSAGQQNDRTAAPTPSTTPTPERRQPAAEEAARAQAAGAAAANANAPAAVAGQPTTAVDPAAQSPASTPFEPTPSPAAATPAAEPQIAQARQPNPAAPITTNQPAAATQTGASLGTFLTRNWVLALVFALVVVGLGLVFAARRTAAARPAPAEGPDDQSAAKAEEPRAPRAKEAAAQALKEAPVAARTSTLDTAQASTVSTPEPVINAEPEPFGTSETVSAAEASEVSEADVKPLTAATALAGVAALAKSRKQSRKEARRKKKGARAEEAAHEESPVAESTAAAPVAQETVVEESAAVETIVEESAAAAPFAEEPAAVEPAVEETAVREEPVVETPPVEEMPVAEVAAVAEEATVVEEASVEAPSVKEPVWEEPVEVAQAVTTAEVAEVVAEPEAAEMTAEPERVLDETRSLLEGEAYDRAVVGSGDAMARQMVAAELLSALAGRNALRRERAGVAFVEHGYLDETARDLREADAPAERSAAARSLAILGDRRATPLLIAALGDPVSDVRRAAVEALGALRDPSAVEPLEALLEREKKERNRIPPRVIRTIIEICREGFAESPTAVTQTAAPAASFATETAPTEEAADVFEALPAEETAPVGFAEEGAATVEVATVGEAAAESFAEPAEESASVEEVDVEPVAADASKGLTPSAGETAAGEWFDFDIGEMGGEERPAASATSAPEQTSTEPFAAEPVFETSSGEAFTAPAVAEVEEAAPVAETHPEATLEAEVAGETAEAPPALHEPEHASAAYAPAAETREKGLAPFDEFSTVPASIQQRLASSSPAERAAAIVELSHVDTDEAFQQICAAFDDESRDVRAAAARALHELRNDRAESFTRALREATPERRREIGAAISSSGLAATSISQLTGESRERTYEAFSLLFLMAKAGEVQPLLRAIEGHPNTEVRLAVVKLLALSGQKEVLPAFRRLAVRGSLPTEVRSAVMEAIYQISSSQPTHA